MLYTFKFVVPKTGYPMNLGLVFVDNQFYARVSVGLPAAYRVSDYFPFVIKIDCEKDAEVAMFVGEHKVCGEQIGEFYELGKETDYNPEEIKQDLRATGSWDKFPELEKMI
jgi:hypothetical protein